MANNKYSKQKKAKPRGSGAKKGVSKKKGK